MQSLARTDSLRPVGRRAAPLLLLALLLPARAEFGPCSAEIFDLPPTALDFAALDGDKKQLEAKLHQPDVAKREEAHRAQRLFTQPPPLPPKVPIRPLGLRGAEAPAPLRNLSEAKVLRLLKDTRWGRRARNALVRERISVATFMQDKSEGGNPLYIDHQVNDVRLRRLFQKVPDAFKGVRRQPVAVLAKPNQGLEAHALPEPRWVLQVLGRSTWKLWNPEDRGRLSGLRVPGCGDDPPEAAPSTTCELRPGALLYVPANWSWSSCAQADDKGSNVTLAVGAGGYSTTWPETFHQVASGDVAGLKATLEETPSFLSVVDALSSFTATDIAAMVGDLSAVKLLQSLGARPNDTASVNKVYPVHQAAMNSHEDLLQWLVDPKGGQSRLNFENKDGMTPLHLASENGHTGAVKILLKAGADVHLSASAKTKYTAAHMAARAGHVGVLRLLRAADADLTVTDQDGCDLTATAAQSGDVKTLEFFLVEEGLSPDARCDHGQTAAHLAAAVGHTAVLDILKRRRANLALKDHNNHTALHTAVQLGREEVVEWFRKADVKGVSPKTAGLLHLAVGTDNVAMLKLLMKHGADASKPDPVYTMPPLEVARSWEVYQILADGGAQPLDGYAHRVAGRGALDLLKTLEERRLGGSLEEEYDGLYPAHLAAQGGHAETLKWLCGGHMRGTCFASSSSKTYRRRPLHFAAHGGGRSSGGDQQSRLDAVKYLVEEHGDNGDWPDDEGITPLELAGFAGHLPVVQYLVGESKAKLGGLWRAKRFNSLHKEVEKWSRKHAPGAYEEWLAEQKNAPLAAAPKTAAPETAAPKTAAPGDKKKKKTKAKKAKTADL